MSTPETTRTKHGGAEPWKPGQSGNPAGRPKGSRNKLGEAFVQALHADFEEHGVSVIETVRIEKPAEYLKVVASLLPKELKIERSDELSDAEVDQRLRQLAELIGTEIGISRASGTEKASAGSQPADKVPPLH